LREQLPRVGLLREQSREPVSHPRQLVFTELADVRAQRGLDLLGHVRIVEQAMGHDLPPRAIGGERRAAIIVSHRRWPHNPLMSVIVREVPCLGDNYAYLVHRDGRREVVVIDASAAGPVIAALDGADLTPVAVLCTHHHYDHVGGNEELEQRYGTPIYAFRGDRGRVPGQSHDVDHEVPFELAGLDVRPLHVPGHTRGAVAYCIGDGVFTGDTLFVAGCGRLFEGTAEQMAESLLTKLAALPPETRVFCGHEYTVTNLRFAASAEPDNEVVKRKLEWAMAQLDGDRPTVPSTIAEELATNPFMRCSEPTLVERFGPGSPTEVFAALRRAKDAF
jgi:hydroxyacylglutathione hydrolase